MSKLFRAVVKVVKVQSCTDFPLSANISCHTKCQEQCHKDTNVSLKKSHILQW